MCLNLLRFAMLCVTVLSAITASAFQDQGYEWEIINNGTAVRCDGFVWGKPQRVADIPTEATNSYTQKTYPCHYVYGISHCDILEELYVPSSITTLGPAAFSYNPKLHTVVLPEKVEASDWLASEMFSGCTSLEELTLPSCERIGQDDQGNDIMMTDILIPTGLCNGCRSLKKVVMLGGCNFIQDYAFTGCKSLTDIYVYSTIPPKIDECAFFTPEELYGTDTRSSAPSMTATLHVPEESIELYRDSPWGEIFKNIVAAPTDPKDAGVDQIVIEDRKCVYDINGVFVGHDTTSLPTGLYIECSGFKCSKIFIK